MTGGLSPEAARRLKSRVGGHARVLKAGGGAAASAPARAGFLARFEREVDPDRTLPPEKRQELAEVALSLYMSRLALRRGQGTAKKPKKKQKKKQKKTPAAVPPAVATTPPLSWADFLARRDQATGLPAGE